MVKRKVTVFLDDKIFKTVSKMVREDPILTQSSAIRKLLYGGMKNGGSS